jgi:hypothetical protein
MNLARPPALGSDRHALRVFTDAGVAGEYVGGSAAEYSAIGMTAPRLIGRNAFEREPSTTT